jgi:hypothetical protein
MSKVNRISLLKKGFCIEFLNETTVNTSYFPYKTIRSISYKHQEATMLISYRNEFEEYTFHLEIPKDCMITTRKNDNSHFCERIGKDRIRNLYNLMTMEYMTNHYDKD